VFPASSSDAFVRPVSTSRGWRRTASGTLWRREVASKEYSLKEIADVLGHRDIRSTFIYTKVDFRALRPVALEWPEEVIS